MSTNQNKQQTYIKNYLKSINSSQEYLQKQNKQENFRKQIDTHQYTCKQLKTLMTHNDDNYFFFNEIFHSDTPDKHPNNQEARNTTIDLLNYHRIDANLNIPMENSMHASSYQSKWSETDKKNYCKFYLKEFLDRPFLCISWNYWKPDQTLPRMANFIKTKDMKQCKSYDERMKQENFNKRNKDIFQYVFKEIQIYQHMDKEISPMIKQIQQMKEKKSEHMEFIENDHKRLREIDLELQKLWPRKKKHHH